MKVYVLKDGQYEEMGPHSVYSTMQKARDGMDAHAAGDNLCVPIEEFELDAPLPEAPPLRWWKVMMLPSLERHGWPEKANMAHCIDGPFRLRVTTANYGQFSPHMRFVCHVKARGPCHAEDLATAIARKALSVGALPTKDIRHNEKDKCEQWNVGLMNWELSLKAEDA